MRKKFNILKFNPNFFYLYTLFPISREVDKYSKEWYENMSYDRLRNKIKQLPSVSTRPMFGYECFSTKGKFFVGLSKKNTYEVIIRLPKDEQQNAVKNKGIKPFRHGARAGWIEIDTKLATTDTVFRWIKKGYAYALSLSNQSRK